MALVIPFEDVVRNRHRRREQAHTERCVEIIRLNLRLALDDFETAAAHERPLYARRVRQLGALLEYAVDLL